MHVTQDYQDVHFYLIWSIRHRTDSLKAQAQEPGGRYDSIPNARKTQSMKSNLPRTTCLLSSSSSSARFVPKVQEWFDAAYIIAFIVADVKQFVRCFDLGPICSISSFWRAAQHARPPTSHSDMRAWLPLHRLWSVETSTWEPIHSNEAWLPLHRLPLERDFQLQSFTFGK